MVVAEATPESQTSSTPLMYQSALRSSYRLHISIDRLRGTCERRTRQKTTIVAIVDVADASNVLPTIGGDVAIEYVQHKDSDI